MERLNMSDTETDFIRVQIESSYVPDASSPTENRYIFKYDVRISNLGTTPARLISRHWIINDALGKTEEVKGIGVIGEQPRLAPGESHSYSSFCPLPTNSGSMRGTYQMLRDDGTELEVEIGEFKLFVGYVLN